MADLPVVNRAAANAPKDYLVPQSQEFILKAVNAAIDGSLAGSAFLPALQLISPAGDVMFTAVNTQSGPVAAGGSADVSWFPGLTGNAPAQQPSPNPLGTVWAWWDFSDTTTTTLDGSGNIQTIKDKTGNGHDAGQGTSSQRPAVGTLNALACGVFTSASQTVLIASGWTTPLASPFTYFVVWTQTIASSAHYVPGPVGGWEIAGDDSPPILFDNFTNSNLVMEAGPGSILIAKAAPYTQQQATMVFNNGSSTFRLNGVAQGGTTNEKPITNVALGSSHWPQVSPPDVDLMDGKIGEVLIYKGALAASQISAVESYLKTKWATP